MLYVDDEANNLIAFHANFRRQFEIVTASSALEGLSVLAREEVHVVITDQRMPGIKGAEFLTMVKEQFPDPVRMVLSGYSDTEAIIEAINKAHIYKCLSKPWDNQEIVVAIQEGYEIYRTNKERMELIATLQRANEQLSSILYEKLAS